MTDRTVASLKRYAQVQIHSGRFHLGGGGCRSHGCNLTECVLCKHNPHRRCTGNFAPKYWVGDRLLAKCEGEIQVTPLHPAHASHGVPRLWLCELAYLTTCPARSVDELAVNLT